MTDNQIKNQDNRGNLRSAKVVKNRRDTTHHQAEKGKAYTQQEQDAFIVIGDAPSSKLYASKKVSIKNPIIHIKLKEFSIIGHNIACINGGLIRYRAFEGIPSFEKYVKILISNVNKGIFAEIKETERYLKIYQSQGYEFLDEGKSSTSEMKLFTASSNLLIETFLLLDKLITNLNYLEKCNHYPSSEKTTLERQWSKVPNEVNKRIMNLQASIEEKFKIKLRRGNKNREMIDNIQIKNLLKMFSRKKSKIPLTYLAPLPGMEKTFQPNAQKLG